MCAKYCKNPTMLSKVTAKNVGDVFLRHTVYSKFNVWASVMFIGLVWKWAVIWFRFTPSSVSRWKSPSLRKMYLHQPTMSVCAMLNCNKQTQICSTRGRSQSTEWEKLSKPHPSHAECSSRHDETNFLKFFVDIYLSTRVGLQLCNRN